MSGSEIPDFNTSPTEAETTTPENLLAAYEVDLADKLELFKQTLDSDRQADVILHTFNFRNAELPYKIFVPPHIRKAAKQFGRLDSVDLECSFLKGSGGTTFSLQFEFCDDQNDITRITVERPYNYNLTQSEHQDIVSTTLEDENGRPIETDTIRPFNFKQFNRCLASLVYSGPNIKLSLFDSFDWHNEDFDTMADNFMSVADYTTSSYEYLLDDEQGGLAGSFSYETFNDTMASLQLYRLDRQHIDAGPDDIRLFEDAIETTIAPINSHRMTFCKHSRVNEQYSQEMFNPNASDFVAMFDFIDKQIQAVEPTQIEAFDDDSTQPPED